MKRINLEDQFLAAYQRGQLDAVDSIIEGFLACKKTGAELTWDFVFNGLSEVRKVAMKPMIYDDSVFSSPVFFE